MWDSAPGLIQSQVPLIFGFMAVCLTIAVVAAVVRSVSSAVSGRSGDADE